MSISSDFLLNSLRITFTEGQKIIISPVVAIADQSEVQLADATKSNDSTVRQSVVMATVAKATTSTCR